MKIAITGVAALLLGASPLLAGGIERAPQSLNVLFEEGNYVELSFGGVDPTIEGKDFDAFGGASTGDVAQGYGFVGLAYKHQFNQNLSAAFIMEQPFGMDVLYPGDGSNMLGGTKAEVNSTTFTALARYKFDNNFSIHGGLRGSQADAEVTLNGLAYVNRAVPPTHPAFSGLQGYNAKFDSAWGLGYVIGAAYEVPDIAARVSLTYNSSIEHDFDTVETNPLFPGYSRKSETTVKTPQSLTLEGQSGIAPDTLAFGSIRWVKWSEFKADPNGLVRAPSATDPFGFGVSDGLVDLEDTTTYTIGVGRKFTDNWSGSVAFIYEPTNDDEVSPLAPYDGRKGIQLAAIYTMDNIKITTGITYAKLGDAKASPGGTPVAQMEDSDVWGAGIRIGYSF
ncbi:outer membrane protein transport protein [Paracoccus sp. 11-3]|uniref:Outer membrane protein transport protein n=1 Tax=Paracoccus amoyensis TaxID=2760093 RepID=A0A926JC01_9RHOB|nr:outer membrane protein transport protein [Paracoccus amoyensis]MBC9245844.1 outer membrane protein transport protein [Paracoccus amoyensis]